jgi:hypothetical protein
VRGPRTRATVRASRALDKFDADVGNLTRKYTVSQLKKMSSDPAFAEFGLGIGEEGFDRDLAKTQLERIRQVSEYYQGIVSQAKSREAALREANVIIEGRFRLAPDTLPTSGDFGLQRLDQYHLAAQLATNRIAAERAPLAEAAERASLAYGTMDMASQNAGTFIAEREQAIKQAREALEQARKSVPLEDKTITKGGGMQSPPVRRVLQMNQGVRDNRTGKLMTFTTLSPSTGQQIKMPRPMSPYPVMATVQRFLDREVGELEQVVKRAVRESKPHARVPVGTR